MSRSLESLLDATLDMRLQRRQQHHAEQLHARQAIDAAHAKTECEQMRFHTEVRSLLQQAVDRANRHLAKRPEHCEFREVSEYYTGPLFVGKLTCNPIVYELHADGAVMAESLLVELTPDGTVEASLSQPSPTLHESHVPRIEFGWRPVRVESFTAAAAVNLVVQYVAAITKRWPLGRHIPLDRPVTAATGSGAGTSHDRL